jgi:hypothetical protein
VDRLRRVRLCRHHYDGPDEQEYGGDGCVICVLNQRDYARAEIERLQRIIREHSCSPRDALDMD